MKESNIVLTPLPQADGQLKPRPALILKVMPPYNDFLVCGISTQLRQCVKGFDDIINDTDNDYKQSGLLQPSLVRLSFLVVLPQKFIIGSLGSISILRHHKLLKTLATYLTNF